MLVDEIVAAGQVKAIVLVIAILRDVGALRAAVAGCEALGRFRCWSTTPRMTSGTNGRT